MLYVFLLNVGEDPKYSSLIAICSQDMQIHGLGAYFTNIPHHVTCSQVLARYSPNTFLLHLCDGIRLTQTSPSVSISDIPKGISHHHQNEKNLIKPDTDHRFPRLSLHSPFTLT